MAGRGNSGGARQSLISGTAAPHAIRRSATPLAPLSTGAPPSPASILRHARTSGGIPVPERARRPHHRAADRARPAPLAVAAQDLRSAGLRARGEASPRHRTHRQAHRTAPGRRSSRGDPPDDRGALPMAGCRGALAREARGGSPGLPQRNAGAYRGKHEEEDVDVGGARGRGSPPTRPRGGSNPWRSTSRAFRRRSFAKTARSSGPSPTRGS